MDHATIFSISRAFQVEVHEEKQGYLQQNLLMNRHVLLRKQI